ncbi:MAG: YceD family protein [Pyrinomonadaceae bacterium]
MRIEVEELKGPGRTFSHTYREGELQLEDERAEVTSATEVSGRATRTGEEVRLQGSISTNLDIACDRCLKPASFPLQAPFDVAYVSDAAALEKSEATELLDEELALSVYEGDSVDLDELAREQILLALPVRTLCREDCKGLCPNCGADLNAGPCACPPKAVDPRWGALAALKNQGG